MIGLYTRVSTKEQAENGYSIGEQESKLRQYAEIMNLHPVRLYADPGYSGSNIERPALQSLISDVRAGLINKVLVYKLDRLSRSQLDTLFLIEKVFLANKCDFVSISENFDTSSPFGRAMIGILAVFAQLEREQIKERMSIGRDARAKEGKWKGGGRIPIGYDYINGELIVNDFENAAIQKIFSGILSGQSPYQIADQLTAEGYTTKYNDHWIPNTVRNVARSRLYLGELPYKNKWIPGSHPALIDQKTFDAAQTILKNRSEYHSIGTYRRGFATSYLSGLLVCAHCGAKYSKQSRNRIHADGSKYRSEKYCCYSRSKFQTHMIKDPNCKNKIWTMKTLDNIVFEQVKRLKLDDIRTQTKKNTTAEENALKTQINALRDRINKLLRLYSVDNMPVDQIAEQIKTLNDQKTALEKTLSELKDPEDHSEEMEAALLNFETVLNNADFDQIRAILQLLIRKIEIDNDQITIFWTFKAV